jgi:hypothetical protein
LPFSGNVETIPLDEVFQFVSTNSLDGCLTIAGGGARLALHFENGHMFFPFSAKRGTYSLGKILRQTGVLSREALEKHLESARKNRLAELRALESQASAEQIEEARRKQYEEEIHDAFLWRRAYFEFVPGAAPEAVQVERSQGKGVLLDPTAFLMEVAHRADERRRIRFSIPSARVILVATPGAEPGILKELAAKKIDVTVNPFDGTRSLEELLDAWGIPHHQSLATIAPLVEGKKLVPLALERARSSLESELRAGNGRAATRYVSHLVELAPPPAGAFDLGPEKELLSSRVFTTEEEVTFTTRVPGTRTFAVLRELVARRVPFTVTAREDGREKRIALSEQQLSVQASADDATPSMARYLRRANVIAEDDLKAAMVIAEEQKTSLAQVLVPGKISEDDWLVAAVEKVIDELAEVFLWRDVDLEVRNRSRAFSGKGEVGALALALPLTDPRHARLEAGLAEWGRIAASVYGEDAIFRVGEKTQASDPAARFFGRFDGKRTVSDLRRVAKAEPIEFLRFLDAGLKRQYARPPTREELLQQLEEVLVLEDDVLAYKLARAGVLFGFGSPFVERLNELRARDAAPSPDSRPSIEGDMNGLSLAAVLQGLRGRKRTGTLVLTNGKRDARIYFHRGSVYLLRIEDASAEDFVNFFLEGEEQQLDFLSSSSDETTGPVDEANLGAAQMRKLKDDVLDVLFWDEARFAFLKNDLPNEFFGLGKQTTKVALDTDVFLMEAIGRIEEWDSVRQAIPSSACRLAFASAEAKFEAIRELGMPEVLTLVDGRKSFEDVVRISGQSRLEVGKALRGLVAEEKLLVVQD